MNTPAHVVLNLALLSGGERRRYAAPIFWGAALPDLPMFFFYAVQKIWLGLPERAIWSQAYFQDSWQTFFDVFNSIPVALLGVVVGLQARNPRVRLFFMSMLLHCLFDLGVHREDAHGHFFPISDWRFVSPVSYWDPAYFGSVVAAVELLIVALASVLLWRRFQGRWARGVLLGVNLVSIAAYAFFFLGPGLEQ